MLFKIDVRDNIPHAKQYIYEGGDCVWNGIPLKVKDCQPTLIKYIEDPSPEDKRTQEQRTAG